MRKSKSLFIFLTIPAFLIIAFVLSSDQMKSFRAGSTKEAAANDIIAENIPEDKFSSDEEYTVTDDPDDHSGKDIAELNSNENDESDNTASPLTAFSEYDIHLLMVGDNLCHYGVVYEGLQEDGTYNFDYEFEGIAEFLELADIKIINQETPFGGNEKGVIAYPKFNTPTEMGDAIAKAGFNVMLAATNHAGDMGKDGLYHFYHYMHDNFPEVLLTGIHGEDIVSKLPNTVIGEERVRILTDTEKADLDLSCEETSCPEGYDVTVDASADYSRINLLKIHGFVFAFLNYTYSNNYETVFPWQEGHLDFLTVWDPVTRRINMKELNPQVLEDIRLARTIADVVVVCPHWGIEHRTTPTVDQKNWAEEMAQAGADIIIGAHPHVPEPVEWITSENGNETLCYYSLGNYASTQNQSVDVLLEGMAWVSFHVTEDGISIVKEESGVVPLVNHYTYGPLRFKKAYLLEDYTAELASEHGVRRHGEFSLKLNDLIEHAHSIFGNYILTRAQIETQCSKFK